MTEPVGTIGWVRGMSIELETRGTGLQITGLKDGGIPMLICPFCKNPVGGSTTPARDIIRWFVFSNVTAAVSLPRTGN